VIHEIPLERRTLHGHFSSDLEPVAVVDPGDTIVFSTLDAGWHVEPRRKFEPLDAALDFGHALIGPIELRGARAGQTLEVRIQEVRVGSFGWTSAGGWSTWLNDRLGVVEGGEHTVRWSLDADAGLGRTDAGQEVELKPFLGVMGMPPPQSGTHSTGPPRIWGGNLDCKELVVGTTLLLPIPVDGALFSAGDCHARQGDGESSGTAIECPLERARLTLNLRNDLELSAPVAWTSDAWITFGFDEDLDDAVAQALDGMLQLMSRELSLGQHDALALASVVVDLRVTQVVNGVKGVHAVLRHDAIRMS